MIASHIFLANAKLINQEWCNSLPDDLQQTFDEVLTEATDYQWQLQAEANIRDQLSQSMTIVELSDEELAAYRKQTSGVFELVRDEAGNEIIDLMLQSVEEANANAGTN